MRSAMHRIHIKDAFLVFRALCKLSMKVFPEGLELLALTCTSDLPLKLGIFLLLLTP
jgi:hypothetical protein